MNIIIIDCNKIKDWSSFHDYSKVFFGFPDFYGANMNAWIDCMTYIDDENDGMTKIKMTQGSILTIHLINVTSFKNNCSEIYNALVDAISFVNYRRIELGEEPVLALAFEK